MRFLAIVCVIVAMASTANAWWMFGGSGRQQAQGDISEQCIAKAEAGECQFYVCFDQRHPCEHHNYALSYGWRFCDAFDKNMGKFNQAGQRYLNGTRRCAMTAMLEHYRADVINCRDVELDMKDARAACEAQNGACDHEMLAENKGALMDVYKINRRFMIRFLNTLRECSKDAAGEFITWVQSQRKSVVEIFKGIQARFQGLEDDLTELRGSLPQFDFDNFQFPTIDRLPSVQTEDED